MMFRWVLFVFLALIFLSWLFSKRLPWLEKLGLTSFNSSLDFKILGQTISHSHHTGRRAGHSVVCALGSGFISVIFETGIRVFMTK
ncbi:MAG: hypothetical protein IPQ12_12795 [Polaromonas sp.]|nr:hypothetical protein [Polaromonas sp.]